MLVTVDLTRIGFSLGAVAFGGVSAYLVRTLVQARTSRSWPVVRGQVVDSSVHTFQSAPWRVPQANVTIHYTYTVGGVAYRGNNLGDASQTLDESMLPFAAKVHMQRYREGAIVDVHYDPRRPSRSILEPGVAPFYPFMTACFVAFAGLCAWWAAVG